MKYFLDPESGDVYGYEEDGSQDAYIRPGLIAIKLDQAQRIGTAKATSTEQAEQAIEAVKAELAAM